MSQEFHIEKASMACAEQRLNELGEEGWLAVNCWPTENGMVALVMKREKTFIALHKRFVEPARPLAELDIKAVLEICLRPDNKKLAEKRDGTRRESEQYGVAVSDVASEFGTTVERALERLGKLGFDAEKKKSLNCKPFWILLTKNGDAFRLHAGRVENKAVAESGAVIASVAKAKGRVKKDTKTQIQPMAATEASETVSLSFQDLVNYCLKNPKNTPGRNPSAPLWLLVKDLKCSEEQILQVYSAAVKADPELGKKYPFATGKGGVRYLNVELKVKR